MILDKRKFLFRYSGIKNKQDILVFKHKSVKYQLLRLKIINKHNKEIQILINKANKTKNNNKKVQHVNF